MSPVPLDGSPAHCFAGECPGFGGDIQSFVCVVLRSGRERMNEPGISDDAISRPRLRAGDTTTVARVYSSDHRARGRREVRSSGRPARGAGGARELYRRNPRASVCVEREPRWEHIRPAIARGSSMRASSTNPASPKAPVRRKRMRAVRGPVDPVLVGHPRSLRRSARWTATVSRCHSATGRDWSSRKSLGATASTVVVAWGLQGAAPRLPAWSTAIV